MKTNTKLIKIICEISLCIFLLFSIIRLQEKIAIFGKDSVQVDFSVYYTTGQNLLFDFPLYKNGIIANPPIWDGLDRYVHSRYLYPPLAAIPFELIASFMTYGIAKFFWMYFSLTCLLVSIFITIRSLKLKLNFWQYLIVGIYTSWFFPLLTSLERGQIDNLTLLLAISAIALAVGKSRKEIVSGFIWTFATLVKLHIGFVAIFFILRKQWKILAGYFFGGVTIVVLTALLLGPSSVSDYIVKEFPRIAKYGEAGTSEMKLPDSYFEKYYNERNPGSTYGLEKDGQWFKGIHLSFAPNASLARFIAMRANDLNSEWQISPTLISIMLLALFLPVAYMALKKIQIENLGLSSEKEFLYWYSILMILMLFGPLTWTMNAVWIIPLSTLAVGQHPWSKDRMRTIPWVLLVVALLLAFVPDCMYLGWRDFASPSSFCKALDSSKYIFSEFFIIISIWLQVKEVKDLKNPKQTSGTPTEKPTQSYS
ncbi:MAG: DUF2029 domain-containing protein [Candidatus Taylorbacteria bacterium]|nr:DUF2029 domain-containing protein [Candidatus Taylorbacteria bacterium]